MENVLNVQIDIMFYKAYVQQLVTHVKIIIEQMAVVLLAIQIMQFPKEIAYLFQVESILIVLYMKIQFAKHVFKVVI